MVSTLYKKLSPNAQANVILAIGVILLCNTLDIIRGLNFIITIISLGLIWYGFIQAGYDKKLKSFIGK